MHEAKTPFEGMKISRPRNCFSQDLRITVDQILEGEGFHNPDLAQVPEHEDNDEFEDGLVATSPCFGLSVNPRNQWIPIRNPGSAP